MIQVVKQINDQLVNGDNLFMFILIQQDKWTWSDLLNCSVTSDWTHRTQFRYEWRRE